MLWTCKLTSWVQVSFLLGSNRFLLVDTPFAGGIFRCKLVIGYDFPQTPPKGYFLTKIFHPNVATPSGEICVNTLKRDWNP
jgi:ubiquitin-protein ligase